MTAFSAYDLDLMGGLTRLTNLVTQIMLWSFGVFYGHHDLGGVFLNRFRCTPLLTSRATLPSTIWQMDALPPLTRPNEPDRARLRQLLPALFDWISGYERTILTLEGVAYREACVAQWSRQHLVLPATGFVAAWDDLADVIRQIEPEPSRATANR